MTHRILADADVRSHWAHLPSSYYFTLSPEETSLCNNFLVEKRNEYRNKEEGSAEMLQVLELDAYSTGRLGLRGGLCPSPLEEANSSGIIKSIDAGVRPGFKS